jgi:serine/threonine protein kinase
VQAQSLSSLYLLPLAALSEDEARAEATTMDFVSDHASSACGGTQHGRFPEKAIEAFVLCTQLGFFTSIHVMHLKAVSKVVAKEVCYEFSQLQVRIATKVHNKVRSVADRLSSGAEGISGSLTAASLVKIFECVEGGIEGKFFLDAGCGHGIPVLIAALCGAGSSLGVDTVANLQVFSRIFMAARSSLGISPHTANIVFTNLEDMEYFPPGIDILYTFWESINPIARGHILQKTSQSTATFFACTNAPDETPEMVCFTLNESCSERNFTAWFFSTKFSVTATGGAMQRQAWIFKRKRRAGVFLKKAPSLDFPSDLLVSLLKLQDDNRIQMQMRKREGSSGLSAKEFIMIGEALISSGFTKFQALGRGGFGTVVRAKHTNMDTVLKIGNAVFSDQDAVNDSLHRELDILDQLKHQVPPVSAEPLLCFHGTSALVKIHLGEGRNVSVLCMQSCWGDCYSLRTQFRNEFLRDGALSCNCCLFFQKVLQLLSVLHKRKIVHNDIKWSNILQMKKWNPDEGFNIVFGDFGNSLSYFKGTQYVTKLAASIPNPIAQARICSNRAKQCLRKAVHQPALRQPTAKKGSKQAVPSIKHLTHVTEASLKKIMDTNQLLLLSAGTPGYMNEVMVKLSQQKGKKAKKDDIPQLDFIDACNHDVRSVGAMLCEVMHGKSDSVKAKGRKSASRQYELALDKLKNLQEVSDFLLQEKSDPISKASQQTKLLCQLVLGMLRSDAKQISAEAAARHKFFSVVIDSTSLDDQVAGSWQQPGA